MDVYNRYERQPSWPELGLYGWGIFDQYSNARIAYDTEDSASWWWLRSPGSLPYFTAMVQEDGRLYLRGAPGSRGGSGVRPALWLNLDF